MKPLTRRSWIAARWWKALLVWAHCGLRLDLPARCFGWQLLSLREVIDDAQADWTGCDDAAWERDADVA